MQQIYKRTLTPKCDFDKFAKKLYWKHTSAWVFCKFAAYYQNTFSQEHLWRAASANDCDFGWKSTKHAQKHTT